ncbi:Mannosyl-3-phosphoglycerate phosphatase [Vibrio thalassae]|uniref:Mannosyl-3-phosphoglycerate phosphatase n=1 Tax=Vibrio thalassae TaxID=1243014 RepID=A0A240ENR4_9VIBR|nr:HAD-IIB family hydrolase [Vibrio thalassae]SNX50264.1 Mannosyl-3-phosphoglycerate phosphatase [Vibrio thalassae]
MKSIPNTLPADWSGIKWVLTDVDDTLTWRGKLPPETLIALSNLQRNGFKVVAVTGACAGWCDHIAQLWPVDAVLGENGAFTLQKIDGVLQLSSTIGLEEIRQRQTKLRSELFKLLKEYPPLTFSLDQPYRLCDVAIDIGQNVPKPDPKLVEDIIKKIHVLGANATASSIHINAWYGEHSKQTSALTFLRSEGLSDEDIKKHVCFIGDSANDQGMFEVLPKSVGVANINKYWDSLIYRPSIVVDQPGGYGFVNFANQLIDLKGD